MCGQKRKLPELAFARVKRPPACAEKREAPAWVSTPQVLFKVLSYGDAKLAAGIARLCKCSRSSLALLSLCPNAFAQQIALVTGRVPRTGFDLKALDDATGGFGRFSQGSWFLFIGKVPLKCAACHHCRSSPVYRWGRGQDSTYVCCMCLFQHALVKPSCCSRATLCRSWPFVHAELTGKTVGSGRAALCGIKA